MIRRVASSVITHAATPVARRSVRRNTGLAAHWRSISSGRSGRWALPKNRHTWNTSGRRPTTSAPASSSPNATLWIASRATANRASPLSSDVARPAAMVTSTITPTGLSLRCRTACTSTFSAGGSADQASAATSDMPCPVSTT